MHAEKWKAHAMSPVLTRDPKSTKEPRRYSVPIGSSGTSTITEPIRNRGTEYAYHIS